MLVKQAKINTKHDCHQKTKGTTRMMKRKTFCLQRRSKGVKLRWPSSKVKIHPSAMPKQTSQITTTSQLHITLPRPVASPAMSGIHNSTLDRACMTQTPYISNLQRYCIQMRLSYMEKRAALTRENNTKENNRQRPLHEIRTKYQLQHTIPT